MGGAALLLSDVAPYERFTDGENCFKAQTPADFLKKMQHLVANREETKQLAAAAKEYVLTERTTQAQINLWREAIKCG